MKIKIAARRSLPAAAIVVVALLTNLGGTLYSRPVGLAGSPQSAARHGGLNTQQDSTQMSGDPDLRQSKEGPLQSLNAYQLTQRSFPLSTIPPSGYPLGMRAADSMVFSPSVSWKDLGPHFAPDANFANPRTGSQIGVSGRATALAVVPSTCSGATCGTIYLGTANGGVWKTTDSGRTWSSILDRIANEAVGVITLDPKNPDIVYVGTGEPNRSGDSHGGIGILRSVDGGRTWTTLGAQQFLNRAVASLVVDPRTAGSAGATLYAISIRATSGGASTGGAASRTNPFLPPVGFYVSKDGGKTWKLSDPPGAVDGGYSLVMDPTNPDVLYAAFSPDPADPGHHGTTEGLYTINGVYKTTDGGKTWVHLTDSLPTTPFDRITLAVAPSSPQILYAAYQLTAANAPFSPTNSNPSHLALFKTADGGATWKALPNTPNACTIQCEYDMPVTIDPTDPNVVYLGGSANYNYLDGRQPECSTFYPLPVNCGATVIKTTDGGNTWADVSENGNGGPLHPDDHIIVISPTDRNVVLTANDGGVALSSDGAATWTDLNRGLGTIQFTGLAVAPDGTIYAGTQDNGTFKYTGSTTWAHIYSGDGGLTAVDPKNPNIIYMTNFGPSLVRNDQGGDPKHTVSIAPFWPDSVVKGLGQFYEPYAIDPSKPSTIFFGTYRIWRSNLRGGVDGDSSGDVTDSSRDKNDWVPISFDLRCGSKPRDPAKVCNGPTSAGKGIASMAVSPVNPNVVAVGASNGHIWLTTNALAPVKTDSSCSTLNNLLGGAICNFVSGPTWRRIDKNLPQRYPTSIKFAPGSSSTLYVTFSGFTKSSPGYSGHVFRSVNAGATWTNLNGTGKNTTLPDLPFSDIVINPTNGHLYASTDYGIYGSFDAGRTWQRIDKGLPTSPIYQMQYYAKGRALIAATHGRGIWETPAP